MHLCQTAAVTLPEKCSWRDESWLNESWRRQEVFKFNETESDKWPSFVIDADKSFDFSKFRVFETIHDGIPLPSPVEIELDYVLAPRKWVIACPCASRSPLAVIMFQLKPHILSFGNPDHFSKVDGRLFFLDPTVKWLGITDCDSTINDVNRIPELRAYRRALAYRKAYRHISEESLVRIDEEWEISGERDWCTRDYEKDRYKSVQKNPKVPIIVDAHDEYHVKYGNELVWKIIYCDRNNIVFDRQYCLVRGQTFNVFEPIPMSDNFYYPKYYGCVSSGANVLSIRKKGADLGYTTESNLSIRIHGGGVPNLLETESQRVAEAKRKKEMRDASGEDTSKCTVC